MIVVFKTGRSPSASDRSRPIAVADGPHHRQLKTLPIFDIVYNNYQI